MARGLIKTLGLAGAALTAWYFLDPKKGAERRSNFTKSAKDIYGSASDELNRLGKDLSGSVKDLAGGVAGSVTDVAHRVGAMTGLSNGTTDGAEKTGAQDKATSRSESLAASSR